MSTTRNILAMAKAILVHGRCQQEGYIYRWTFEQGSVELIYPEEEQPYQRGSKLRVVIAGEGRLVWEDTLKAIWMRCRLKDRKARNTLWLAAVRLARDHREKERPDGE